MKKDHSKYLICILFFIILAAITFRCVFGSDQVFSASDSNIGRLALAKSSLPESFFGSYTGNQLLGNSGYAVSLYRILLSMMPLTFFANVFFGMVLVVGSISLVWFLRIWGRSWAASVFGALVGFWVNSITLSSGGHPYKMEVLALSVLGLCFIEKAVRAGSIRKSIGFAIFSGLIVGVMMVEQQDVALLAGLFIGPYTLVRLIQQHGKSLSRWAVVLVPIILVSLLLSGSTLVKSYANNIAKASSVQSSADDKWNFITQWSMVPAEWPDLIAPGWGGWSTGNPDGPYWGKIGQSAEWNSTKQGFQNFKLDSIYLGIIPVIFAAFSLVVAFRTRKAEESKIILFWGIIGGIGLLLSFGKYSALYGLFFKLPLVNNIRAPIKLLDNVQICLGIVSAYGVDQMLSRSGGRALKVLWISCLSFFVMMMGAGLKFMMFPSGKKEALTEMGLEPVSNIILTNISNAWFYSAVLTLVCGALVFALWKGKFNALWVGLALITMLGIDSLFLTSHYFKGDDISQLKKGNSVLNFLKENQGNERTFFVDQSGIYNKWMGLDGPYHGLNIFNIWQMPRMQVEYKNFLSIVGKNQIRIWELSSIKYIAAPSGIMDQLQQNPALGKMFKPALNYQMPTASGMRNDVLLEFNGSIPRVALFHGWEGLPLDEQCQRLASVEHNPRTTILVDTEHAPENQSATVEFQPLDGRATSRSMKVSFLSQRNSIVRFSQFYKSNWKVFVDGKPAELLRVDYLCMGVAVGPGEHTVEFRSGGGEVKAVFMFSIFLISVISGTWLLKPERENTGH